MDSVSGVLVVDGPLSLLQVDVLSGHGFLVALSSDICICYGQMIFLIEVATGG